MLRSLCDAAVSFSRAEFALHDFRHFFCGGTKPTTFSSVQIPKFFYPPRASQMHVSSLRTHSLEQAVPGRIQQTRRSLTESEFCCSDSHASWTHVVTSRLEKYFECSCAGMHKGALSRRFAGVVVITTKTAPNFQTRAAARTPDEGPTWFKLPGVSGFWAAAFANPKAGWFVGNGGQILKISF
jgi:hypothetical protein